VCIDPHQIGSVGDGCDHLQLIKFWPFCVSGKGVSLVLTAIFQTNLGLRQGKKFWLHLTTASAQSLRLLSAFFIVVVVIVIHSRHVDGNHGSISGDSSSSGCGRSSGTYSILSNCPVLFIDLCYSCS